MQVLLLFTGGKRHCDVYNSKITHAEVTLDMQTIKIPFGGIFTKI